MIKKKVLRRKTDNRVVTADLSRRNPSGFRPPGCCGRRRRRSFDPFKTPSATATFTEEASSTTRGRRRVYAMARRGR